MHRPGITRAVSATPARQHPDAIATPDRLDDLRGQLADRTVAFEEELRAGAGRAPGQTGRAGVVPVGVCGEEHVVIDDPVPLLHTHAALEPARPSAATAQRILLDEEIRVHGLGELDRRVCGVGERHRYPASARVPGPGTV